jgi:hypothetical protein
MRVKRFIGLAMMAALMLTVAGIAVAHNGGNPGKTEAASATFTATPTDQSTTKTCTGADGTYAITKGVYTGTSTGDPRLTGDVTIKSQTFVNTTNGLGFTEGRVWVRETGTGKVKATAALSAVNTQQGKLDGFLLGSAKDTDQGRVNLAANFSAAFNADGTQLTGELGSEAPVPPQNSAIFFGRPCAKPAKQNENGQGHANDDGKKHENQGGGRGGDGGK